MSVSGKNLCRCIWTVLALSLLSPAIAPGDIYKYIDQNGVMHFTNTPTASSAKYRVYLRESPPVARNSALPGSYEDLIHQAAEQNDIAAALIRAIIRAESNFNPRAVSKKGASGLMQIMPVNFASLNIRDPFDPKQNIMGGVRYFKQMMNRFGGKLHLALAAYNAGPEKVEQYQRVPPIRETENYVQKVLRFYNHYKNG